MVNEKEKTSSVQFYCDDQEYAAIKSAAEKEMRSIASFTKYNTVKAAQSVNEKAV